MVTAPNDPAALASGAAPGGVLVPTQRPSLVADPPVASSRTAPLPVVALVAAGWATLLGLAPLVALTAVGAIGSGVPFGSVLRLGTAAWLLGHGVPVQTPADRISLVPLGITAFVVWRLVRAGVHASRATRAHRRRGIGPAVRAGAAVAVAYTAVGSLLAWLGGGPDVGASPGRAAFMLAAVSGLAASAGALTHGPAARARLARIPAVLTDGVRAGLTAFVLLLAAGAATAGVALALAGGDATAMLASYEAGVPGQIGITAICLVYLPNLAVWSAAYLLGPGFAVGTGTVVSPGDVLLGPVPGLPVFAALPSGPLTGPGPVLLGAPLLAGLCAGYLLARRRPGGWAGLLAAALLAGPVTGVVLHGAIAMSRGGLGSGRLADLGPMDWRTGIFAAGVTLVGTVAGAVAARTVTRP